VGALQIRSAGPADAAAMAGIYNHFIQHTIVTFEEEPVAAAEFAGRVAEVEAAGLPFLVAETDGRVAGYAYASKWKGRCGYRFSAEVSVYLAPDRARQGLGTALYGALFPMLQAKRIHAVMGGIALPNEASVALHEKFGMTQVATFSEVGFKFGRWIDVGYWQRLFEA
jgi:L-amino acid N-acyltransferase YncA